LISAVASKAHDSRHPEQIAAARFCLDALGREAKLLGLDAPVEIAVSTPDRAEIARFIAQASGLSDLPEEADILDVEVLDDDADAPWRGVVGRQDPARGSRAAP